MFQQMPYPEPLPFISLQPSRLGIRALLKGAAGADWWSSDFKSQSQEVQHLTSRYFVYLFTYKMIKSLSLVSHLDTAELSL